MPARILREEPSMTRRLYVRAPPGGMVLPVAPIGLLASLAEAYEVAKVQIAGEVLMGGLVGQVFDDPNGLSGRWPIRRPGRRGPVMLPIERHCPTDSRLTGRLLPPAPPRALRHQPAHTEPPGARVLLLHLEDLFEEGEGQLLGRMGRRVRALSLTAGAPVTPDGHPHHPP